MDDDRPGAPGHPMHEAYLTALGQAMMSTARLSGTAFDLLRVIGDVPAEELYDDPLGRLESKLRAMTKRRPDVPELISFIDEVSAARDLRNDLLHSLPVHRGLQRRRARDPQYVRNFFEIEDLRQAAQSFDDVSRKGNAILYRDGGAEVRRWSDAAS